mmetsp:Transcript_67683/g.220332  ORF Transcript_67683/g.220332 Transcript_67683/m.220332 type:complete len:300 (+) Transcript_67683:3414-4313(+)
MSRCLNRWEPHLVQSPQSDHRPHWQSVQLPLSQDSVLHAAVSLRASSQGGPSFAAGLKMWRWRVCWPPPQRLVHLDQSSQAPILHDRSGSGAQPREAVSSGPGLHGFTSFRLRSSHFLPWPLAYLTTCLIRSWRPKQLLLQVVQFCHSETSQSWSLSQLSSSPHNPYSSSAPRAGRPQLFARISKSLCLVRNAGEHVAEHLLHSDHTPQAPSMQFSQFSVLHGATSALASAAQSRPPFWGTASMSRPRRFVPPPQELVQPDQWSQSPHLQSTGSHSMVWQALTSESAAVQPLAWPTEPT